jgi:hypothetical protein
MKQLVASILLMAVIFTGCSKSDPPLPAIKLGFESAAQGFGDVEEVTVKVVIDRANDADINFDIDVTPSEVNYNEHFTTTPAVVDGKINVTIPAGSTETSVVVKKADDQFFSGTEFIDFTVKSISSSVVAGANPTLKLSFGAIVSTGTSMRLNGGTGGPSAINSVFVDFSNNKQTSVLRASWHLAFYSGDTYNVLLNDTKPLTAVAVNATDIQNFKFADFTYADSLALGFGSGTFEVVDSYLHDFSKTVIKPVAENTTENKIYVIADAGSAGATPTADQLYKVKINRSAKGYTVQYAKINETTINTIEVEKNSQYNYQFLSFTDKKVTPVEPQKSKWDIEWTYGLYYTNFMGTDIPYAFSDLVYTNHKAGVKIAEVLNTTVTYENYNASHIAATNFSSDRTHIASNWRVTSPSGTDQVGVRKDRFYVVQDADGNVYKLLFVNFHSTAVDGGERGYPNIKYELVKQAD